jgi:hypothetical protein
MASKKEQKKRKIVYGDARKEMAKVSTFEATSVKLPEGVSWFSPKKEGKYTIDILPYPVSNNPFLEEGVTAWPERTYYAHRIGIDNNSYCCPRNTFGKNKPCPVCEEKAKLRKSAATKEEIDALDAKIRQLWVVREYDKAGDPGEIMVWDVSFHLFGKQLREKVNALDEYATFYHLKGGYKLIVSLKQESMGSNTFLKTSNIEMIPRKKEIPESILDEVPCLDDCLIELSAKKIKKILFQEESEAPEDEEDDDGEKDEDSSADSGGDDEEDEEEDEGEDEDGDSEDEEGDGDGDEDDDDADDDDDPSAESLGLEVGMKVKHAEHGVCKIVHVSGDGTAVRLKDADGEVHRAIAPKECKPLLKGKLKEAKSSKEKIKPKAKPAPAKKGKGKPKDEDDGWDDDEEEEEDEDDDD